MAKELIEGNAAIAEAAIRAGCEAFFGYPITPQTEVLEHLSKRMPEEGRVFLQAESEVASINMVYGAACAGARVMTSSSSPGISLMQEGLSYIAAPRCRRSSSTSCAAGRAWATSSPRRATTSRRSRAPGTATST